MYISVDQCRKGFETKMLQQFSRIAVRLRMHDSNQEQMFLTFFSCGPRFTACAVEYLCVPLAYLNTFSDISSSDEILYINFQIMKAVETLSIFVCVFLITWSAGDGAPQWRPQGRFGKRFSSSRTNDFMTALEGGSCKYIEI